MRQVRVLHVITGLPTGGAEMALYRLLAYSDRERFVPTVVSLTGEDTLRGAIEGLGVSVHCLGAGLSVAALRALVRLVATYRRVRPDVVHGWMYHGNLAATLVARRGTALIWGIRHSLYDIRKERTWTQRVIQVGAKLSHRPKRIVYNSRVSAEQHERFGYSGDNTLVIPNGFDCDVLHPDPVARAEVRAGLGLERDAVLVGLIARYHPQKDHEGFFRGAAILTQRWPDVHFCLAGPGIDEANSCLASLIHGLGLSGSVHLLGEREDVPRLTAALDIATSSSAWGEAFSNVLGEAMACGVPCVTTDIGDSAWIVGDTGLVVPPGSPEALAQAWERLLDEGEEGRRGRGDAARRRVQEHFSQASVVAQYESMYAELTA